MAQRFRRNIEDIPSGSGDDAHELCRQRARDLILSWTVTTQICSFCGTKLLLSESSDWCCGRGTKVHTLWSPPPEVQALYCTPRIGDNSRMLNSLFTTAILYSGERSHGLRYHQRSGGGPPALRISGQMYARFLRQPASCWFIHDHVFDQTTWQGLPPQFRHVARELRRIMIASNHPYSAAQSEAMCGALRPRHFCLGTGRMRIDACRAITS